MTHSRPSVIRRAFTQPTLPVHATPGAAREQPAQAAPGVACTGSTGRCSTRATCRCTPRLVLPLRREQPARTRRRRVRVSSVTRMPPPRPCVIRLAHPDETDDIRLAHHPSGPRRPALHLQRRGRCQGGGGAAGLSHHWPEGRPSGGGPRRAPSPCRAVKRYGFWGACQAFQGFWGAFQASQGGAPGPCTPPASRAAAPAPHAASRAPPRAAPAASPRGTCRTTPGRVRVGNGYSTQ